MTCKIFHFESYRRARRGTHNGVNQRARLPERDARPRPGLVSIGVVSTELLRRLTEDD